MNHLQIVVDEIRSRTIRQLDKTDDAEMLTPVPGLQNHLTWHAGHCLWVADRLIVEPATGASELPGGWAEAYGKDCRPPAETSEWATRRELIDLLTKQKDRLMDLLAIEPASVSTSGEPDAKRARQIVHAMHDEASHQGEIPGASQVAAGWQNRRGLAGLPASPVLAWRLLA